MNENLFGEQTGKPKMIPHCEFRTLHGWPHPDTCECKKGKKEEVKEDVPLDERTTEE